MPPLVAEYLLEQRTIGNAMHFAAGGALLDLLVNASKDE